MDLSNFQKVDTANPRQQNFKLKWKQDKESFVFSNQLWEDLSLGYNSLSMMVSKNRKEVLLIVCPGDSGDFYKQRGTSAKRKEFKNASLSKALNDAGMTNTKLDLIHFGVEDSKNYYYVVEEGHLPWSQQPNEAEDKEVIEEATTAELPANDPAEEPQSNVEVEDTF